MFLCKTVSLLTFRTPALLSAFWSIIPYAADCTLALTCFLMFWLSGASSQLFPHSWGISGYNECCSAIIYLPSGVLKMHIFHLIFFSLPDSGLRPLFFSHLLCTVNKLLAYSQMQKRQATIHALFNPSWGYSPCTSSFELRKFTVHPCS